METVSLIGFHKVQDYPYVLFTENKHFLMWVTEEELGQQLQSIEKYGKRVLCKVEGTRGIPIHGQWKQGA